MDLIYYYPPKSRGAPDSVARSVFHQLYSHRDLLETELSVFTTGSGIGRVQSEFGDVPIVSLSDIRELCHHCVVYIPKSPMLSPNDRTVFFVKAIWNKIPVISDYHGDFRVELMNQYYDRNFLRFLWYMPTAIVAPQILRMNYGLVVHSHNMAQMLRRKYCIEKNVAVIPNGIDENLITQRVQPVELDGDPSILYHGRLSYEKGIDILLKSISKLRKDDLTNLKLYIAGSGPLQENLKKLSVDLGIEKNVIYIGHLPHEEIVQYLKSVSLAVYPSRYESFSLAILEALAVADCPVCMSECAGICNFFRRDDDLITFHPHVLSLTKQLQSLISAEVSTNGLVKRQKEVAKRFLWSKIGKQYVEFFNEVAYHP